MAILVYKSFVMFNVECAFMFMSLQELVSSLPDWNEIDAFNINTRKKNCVASP